MIYKIKSLYYQYSEMIKRIFYYGWGMRKSYDFDAWTLYGSIYLKLDRVYDCMLNHSHLMWNSSPDTNLMKKLCEAKNIARMLAKEHTLQEHSYLSEVFSKYTSIKKKNTIFSDTYPDAKIINDKLLKFMTKKAIEKDSRRVTELQERLHYLLLKYTSHWWD